MKKPKSLWNKCIAMKSEKRTKKEWGREEREWEIQRKEKEIDTQKTKTHCKKKDCRGSENYYSFFKNEKSSN